MTSSRRRTVRVLTGLTGIAMLSSSVQAFTAPHSLKAGRLHHSSPLGVAGEDVDVESITIEEGATEQETILSEASGWDNLEATKTVGLKRPVEESTKKAVATSSPLQEQRSRNVAVAVVSIVLAIGNFFWQYSHPVTSVQLLFSMQQSSAPITAIGVNGKPTVVDFWAPWCENCKLSAPTLLKVEQEYKDKVNFVMVNGDQSQAWPYIEAFGVDAIPHMALVSADGDVMTALIGPTPKSVLEADLDVMIKNSKMDQKETKEPLPYVMMDVFANAPERRRVHFDE